MTELGVDDDDLLVNGPDVEPIRGILGVDVDTSTDLYDDLQNAYKGMEIVKWLWAEVTNWSYQLQRLYYVAYVVYGKAISTAADIVFLVTKQGSWP